MVHRKQARGKRKGAADGVPETADHARRGGGAARPGYMRPTSCSGARAANKGAAAGPREGPPPAAPPEREAKAAPRVSRATCSSALKGTGVSGGCEGRRLCRYAYCSFEGHAPAAPPLGSFVASRRRLIKTEQRMKHKGVSPFRKAKNSNGGGGGDGDGFFVQIFPGAAAATNLGVDKDVMDGRMGYVTFDRRSYREGEEDSKENDLDGSVDGSCGSSDVISDGFAELLAAATTTARKEEGEAWVDQEEAEDSGPCKSDISVELGARYESNISKGRGGEASVESSMDDISSAFGGLNFEDVGSDPSDAATSQKNKVIISSRRRTPAEEKRIRIFNPKAPNFLPVRADPDAEKVDLRHQTADDRKSAEEWMVDYALRKAVKKLARARKRKVEMLVQAFETVLPLPGEKNSLQHDDDKKSFTQAKASQACN